TLKAVAWRMDDGADHALDLSKVAGQEITVPLELRRGVHKLRVTVKTPEAAAEYSEGVTLRYQPPSPIVKYTGDKTILVKEPEFSLRALIQSGSKDEPVLVIFSHFGRLAGGEDRIISTEAPERYKTAPDEPKEMTRKLKLEKGYNLVVITAWNQGASADASEAETSRVAVEINYFKDAPPP